MDASFDLIASSESGDELSASRGWIARRTGATAARPAPVRSDGQTLRTTSIVARLQSDKGGKQLLIN